MDYFLELASTPDIYDAIKATPGNESDQLLLREFLREEHPTVWVSEVVRAFYASPSFAAGAWTQLRYCGASRRHLAENRLRDAAAWAWAAKPGWAWAAKKVHPQIQKFVGRFSTEPEQAVLECADALSMADVDALIQETGSYPEPPALLGSLMDVLEARGEKFSRDEKTRDLLAHPENVRKLALDADLPMPFSMVLQEELDQIEATRGNAHRTASPGARPQGPPPEGPPYSGAPSGELPQRRALDMNLLGLAFSGGGIRSATFNLGVLQALAKIGLLRQCDYLSTVSGGGYIGSWLAAWIYRESQTGTGNSSTMIEMQRRLSPPRSPNPMDERVRPIRFLREYSNYLTPRTGFFSADTWTMIGIYLRNALLNQVIIVSLLGAALIVPRLLFWPQAVGAMPPWIAGLFWATGGAVLATNLARLRQKGQSGAATARMGAPTVERRIDRLLKILARPTAIQLGVVLPWLLAMGLIAAHYAANAVEQRADLATRAGLVVAVSFLAILLLGQTHRHWAYVTPIAGKSAPWRRWRAVWVMTLAASVSGIVAAGLTLVLIRAIATVATTDDEWHWHAMALGTGGLLSVLSLSMVAMLGMLGERLPDEQREWWSKLRTFVHVWAIGWVAAFVMALYVPWAFAHVQARGGASWSASAVLGWIASTWFGVHKGRTAEDDKKQQHEKAGDASVSASAMQMAAQAAPFVFIFGLVVAISIAVDQTFRTIGNAGECVSTYWTCAAQFAQGLWTVRGVPVYWTFSLAGILVGTGLLFSWRVDINEFSLHHFYKNRLVRCYLGASHGSQRQADWFTGFDPEDDVWLKDFDHREGAPAYPGPYPILNCALNLVGGEDLAWQERKSASFVFTPKFCGYDVDRAVLSKDRDKLSDDAFVPTRTYYNRTKGPHLGTAMAISGAAANPNMGRASSPALGFLMTVFNVRLGWWVANPRKRAGASRRSPRLGLPYIALELFGGTTDRKRYVNLSDGGHFENLGVYELIRRGCRYIIVCDAGQDSRFVGEDLANLVRQCRTDFGVEIDIDIHRIRDRKDERISEAHCVVGKIHYLPIARRTLQGRLMNEEEGPLLRGSRPAHEEGYLIYLKPSLTGDEPQDIVEYSLRIPNFPHQTTADQWFDESQFESYRKLGMHIAEEAFGRYQDDDTKPMADVGTLFKRLHGYWYPPSQAINAKSTQHVNEYSRILDLVRTQSGLHHLDHTMFERLPESGQVNARDEFYICNALIQLIENVYADLELEHLWQHPHVQGWMTVFKRWAEQPAFQRTWAISEWTYADRFRNFYNDRLRGRRLALPRSFIASRAWSAGAPMVGTTVEACRAAIRQGASVVKVDVWDVGGALLVGHHGTNPIEARLSSLSPSGVLAGPDLETFVKCIDELNGDVQLAVELKTREIEKQVVRALCERDPKWRRRDFVLLSSYEDELKEVRRKEQRIRTGLLVPDHAAYRNALDRFVDVGSDFIGIEERLLSREDLDAAFERRVPVVPFSVNSKERLALLLGHETVAGVVTDDVATAIEVKRCL